MAESLHRCPLVVEGQGAGFGTPSLSHDLIGGNLSYFNRLVPEKSRRPWFTVTLCIFSLSLGMLPPSYLLFPGVYPETHDRIQHLGWHPLVAELGLLCTPLPVTLLSLTTR